MPLSMNREVFITCAVTGSGDTVSKSSHVPVTPKQIAEAAIAGFKEGAKPAQIVADPWTCPDCGERIEPQFTECWNCGASKPANE